ncbi:multifunctional expression regulator [Human betaherpesvirus 5]|uniref:mRNA export factor ICP27 homolog n=1 Tax=Human cytomegalovirus TaxID=10359 RepID=A0A126NE55_HCMV|nr:multifunctional expression regulator [Human betaherpesvirus 5]QZX46761.1 multifunctional expression regulator [Human betaherpesvirus 5]
MELHSRGRHDAPSLSSLSERERRARRARRFCLDYEPVPRKFRRERSPTSPLTRNGAAASEYHLAEDTVGAASHHHRPCVPARRPRYSKDDDTEGDPDHYPPPLPPSSRHALGGTGGHIIMGTAGFRGGHRASSSFKRRVAASASVPLNPHYGKSHDNDDGEPHHHGGDSTHLRRRVPSCPTTFGSSHPSSANNHHGSSAGPQQQQMLALIDDELDAMDEDELQQLSRLIEKKKRARLQRGAASSGTSPSSTSPVYDLQRYTAESLRLAPYPADLKVPTAFPQDHQPRGRILLSHDELMHTDYLLHIRQQFDWLEEPLLRKLVVEKIFAVYNAPNLHTLLAIIDETLSYMKYHHLHGLPVNPHDPYLETVGGMRQLLFNKLNNLDLGCILDHQDGWGDHCSTLKRLVKKPGQMSAWLRDDVCDLQKRPPETFSQPMHRAMAYVCSFSRVAVSLRRRALQVTGTPQFFDQFDTNNAMGTYRCGAVSDLILGALQCHECQNEMCELRIQRALAPYRFMIAYCPFDEQSLLDLTVFAGTTTTTASNHATAGGQQRGGDQIHPTDEQCANMESRTDPATLTAYDKKDREGSHRHPSPMIAAAPSTQPPSQPQQHYSEGELEEDEDSDDASSQDLVRATDRHGDTVVYKTTAVPPSPPAPLAGVRSHRGELNLMTPSPSHGGSPPQVPHKQPIIPVQSANGNHSTTAIQQQQPPPPPPPVPQEDDSVVMRCQTPDYEDMLCYSDDMDD